jgi:hypothetical protein
MAQKYAPRRALSISFQTPLPFPAKSQKACSGCSGCSGFCPNFLASQKSDTWLFQDVQAIQAVHAFEQTFSKVKKVTRGSLRLFGLFRLFRLLPKPSHESKK